MAVMKVMPWGKEQGDFVLIESENFDPNFHVKYAPKKVAKKKTGKKAK